MKAVLTEIELNSSNVYTLEELNKLNKYYSDARFKTENDFKDWKFKDKTEEEQNEILNKYQEYLKQDKKQLYGYTHRFLCDLHIFMHDFPYIKFTVLGSRDVNVDMNNSDAIKLQQNALNKM